MLYTSEETTNQLIDIYKENFYQLIPKLNRLKGYDYSREGLYFVTICCYDRFCFFGHIDNDAMILNQYGQIAIDEWIKLPERYPNFELDVFQIMPNHIHAIISLTNPVAVGATLAVALDGDTVSPDVNLIALDAYTVARNVNTVAPDVNDERAGVNPAPTGTGTGLSDIVGAYNSLVANGCSI